MSAAVYPRHADATQAMVAGRRKALSNPKLALPAFRSAIFLYVRPYFGFADRLV
jgi:hypothetical protein